MWCRPLVVRREQAALCHEGFEGLPGVKGPLHQSKTGGMKNTSNFQLPPLTLLYKSACRAAPPPPPIEHDFLLFLLKDREGGYETSSLFLHQEEV